MFILRAAQLLYKIHEQGYVRECFESSLRKFYRRYGDLIKHYEVSLSQMSHDILGHDHIYWRPLLIRHFTLLWPCYQTAPYYQLWTRFKEVSKENFQRVRLANRGRLLLRTPSPVPFGHCIDLMLILFSPGLLFLDFEFRTSLGTSILLCETFAQPE